MPRFNNDYYARLVNQQSQYLEVAVDMQNDDYYDSPMVDDSEEIDPAVYSEAMEEATEWAEEMVLRTMDKRYPDDGNYERYNRIWVTDALGDMTYSEEAQSVFDIYYEPEDFLPED